MSSTRSGLIRGESLMEKVKDLSFSSEASSHAPLSMSSPEAMSHASVNTQRSPDLKQVYDLISEIKTSIDQHKVEVNKRVKELSTQVQQMNVTITSTIKEEVRAATKNIEEYIDSEISRVSVRIDGIEEKVRKIEDSQHVEYDPNVSIIVSKLPVTPDEDVQQIAEDIVHNALQLPAVQVVRAMRLRQRDDRQGAEAQAAEGQAAEGQVAGGQRAVRQRDERAPGPPLIKVQFRTVEDKVAVLRVKRRLTSSAKYSPVWLRSSKPHSERVMDMNFRTLLDILPGGNTYTVTSNGKIVKKTPR